MDVEERNRQMKMSKYKQVAGSDSRLEQDYHSKARAFCSEKQQSVLLSNLIRLGDSRSHCMDCIFNGLIVQSYADLLRNKCHGDQWGLFM